MTKEKKNPQKNKKKQATEPAPQSQDDWAQTNKGWAKDQLEKAHAHTDRFFMADEDIPLSQHLLLSIIVAFFITFVLWANFATLDEITRGEGKIIPSSEIQKLQSLEGGIIEAFLVKEGDAVEAGQPVIRLRDIQASSDLGANRKRYLGLETKKARLEAEAEAADTPKFSTDVMKEVPQSVQEEMNAFRANKKNLLTQTQIMQQQLSQRLQEVSELKTRISDLRGVIHLSRQERNMIAPLVARGSAPKLELLQLDRGLKEQQTELNSLSNSLPRIESSVTEAKARIAEIDSASRAQAQTELAATIAEMNSIKETLTALTDRKSRTEIRSPVNGVVQDIKISTIGGVVQPGADLIEIVPRDDQLIVEVQIRPSDIAFLHPEQKAVVKITAYDYSIYGGLTGHLVDISPDTISNEKGETFYRVRIRTPETFLKRKGQKLEIIPGMVASVDILTGKKTVMAYLLKPFIKTLDGAMHER